MQNFLVKLISVARLWPFEEMAPGTNFENIKNIHLQMSTNSTANTYTEMGEDYKLI